MRAIRHIVDVNNSSISFNINLPKGFNSKQVELIILPIDGAEKQSLNIDSPSMVGEPMTTEAFIKWVDAAEKMPTVSIAEVKERWKIKKKQLQKISR